jgi:hypothetical protein
VERATGVEPATSSLGIRRIAGRTRNRKDDYSRESWVFIKPAFPPLL